MMKRLKFVWSVINSPGIALVMIPFMFGAKQIGLRKNSRFEERNSKQSEASMKSYKAQLAAMTEEQLAEFKAVRNVKAKREAKKVVEAVTALTDTTEAV